MDVAKKLEDPQYIVKNRLLGEVCENYQESRSQEAGTAQTSMSVSTIRTTVAEKKARRKVDLYRFKRILFAKKKGVSIKEGPSQAYDKKVESILGHPIYDYLCGSSEETEARSQWGWRRKLTIRAHTSNQEHYMRDETDRLKKELEENLDGLVWCFNNYLGEEVDISQEKKAQIIEWIVGNKTDKIALASGHYEYKIPDLIPDTRYSILEETQLEREYYKWQLLMIDGHLNFTR